MTIEEIVERAEKGAFGFNCGMQSCSLHRDARKMAFAVAKAILQEAEDAVNGKAYGDAVEAIRALRSNS